VSVRSNISRADSISCYLGSLTLVDRDAGIKKIVDQFSEELERKMAKPIGFTVTPLDCTRPVIRKGECAVGNWVGPPYHSPKRNFSSPLCGFFSILMRFARHVILSKMNSTLTSPSSTVVQLRTLIITSSSHLMIT
jgi:hypothetical protein